MEQIKYYNGEQLKSLEIVEPNDIIEGLIRETSFSMLVGEEGCGKSIFAMNLALTIATAQDSFLGYKIKKNGKVIYLNNELPFGECVSRFKKMINLSKLNQSSRLQKFIIPNHFPLLLDYKLALDVKCRKEKPILVIIDCLYWTHNNQENDNSEMKNLLRELMFLRDEHQMAILVIHHTKKGVKSESMHNDHIRGASVLAGASDSIFQLRRSPDDEEIRLFKPTKLRYANDKMKKIKVLSLNPENLWFKDEGDVDEIEHLTKSKPRTNSEDRILWDAIIPKDEILRRQDLLTRCDGLGYNSRTIDRALEGAVKSGKLKKVGHGEYSIGQID